MRRLLPLVVLLALVPATPSYAAEPGSGLIFYTVRATAPGLGIEGLYKDVALTVPETTSTLSTGGQGAGLATLAWPGPIAGNLGTTILVLKGSAPPQVTVLNDPVRAETRSGGTQHASYTQLPGTVMTSTATPSKVLASSHTGSQTLPIGKVGAFSGDSSAVLTGATTVLSTASSTASGISLAGGVLKIGSVTSSVTATTDGKVATAKGSTVVGDVTVAGVPVTIDGTGLHVKGTNVPNPVTTTTVNNAVKALGLEVLLTQPRVVRQGGSVSYDAGALVLMITNGSSLYSITLGRASVDVSATQAPQLGGLPFPVPPLPTLPVTRPQPGTVGGAPSLASTGANLVPTVPSPQSSSPSVLAPVRALAAAAVSLAGGAPALMMIGLLALGGMLVLGMRRLPDRVLIDDDADCDEWPR